MSEELKAGKFEQSSGGNNSLNESLDVRLPIKSIAELGSEIQADLDVVRRRLDQLQTMTAAACHRDPINHAQDSRYEIEQSLARVTASYEALLAQQSEVDQLRVELSNVKRQLDATLSSSSWKLTAPLRLLSSRHPGAVAKLRKFSVRHPILRRSAVRVAKFGWRIVSRQSATANAPAPGSDTRRPAPVLVVEKIDPLSRRGLDQTAGQALNRVTGSEAARVLCVGHVLPYPPRAGNEYRIHRMLSWLANRGHDVFVVVCPLPDQMPTAKQLTEAAAVYPNLIVCGRDGTIFHNLPETSEVPRALAGYRTRDLSALLKEDRSRTVRESDLLNVTRTFCPDVLVEVLLKVEHTYRPAVLLAEYVFMTRSFPLLNPSVLKIVDTHDVFSTKASKVAQYGISDGLSLSEGEEAEFLDRADVVIGIQPEETRTLARLASRPRVVNAGVDFLVDREFRVPAVASIVLLVASDNPMNSKGLRDFLRFSWPLIRREVARAEFRVVGDVGRSVTDVPDGVQILGRVDDLSAAYSEATVVINPMIAGTGLKVKTVEALSFLRPIVTFPAGVDGVTEAAAPFCNVATDWYGFAQHVVRLLSNPLSATALTASGVELAEALSPEIVYSQLATVLNEVK